MPLTGPSTHYGRQRHVDERHDVAGATGQAKHPRVTGVGDKHLKAFRAALREIAIDLATQVVRDGEGAQKFVTIDISGAESAAAARRIGLAVANSPLVKTAIAGGDPNWGRIVMAVGRPARKPTETGCPSAWVACRLPLRVSLSTDTTNPLPASTWPDAISLFPLMSVLGAVRRGSGLATSPTATSKSMRIIGRERSWRRNLKTPSLNSQKIPAIAGVRIAGVAAGLKDNGKHDLFVAELARGSTIAGTLTCSRCPGMPVEWSKRQLPGGKVRAIVASSGNSNVFTGGQGRQLVENTAAAAAKLIGCRKSEVFLASTGIIGEKKEVTFVADKVPVGVKALRKCGLARCGP